MEGRVMTLLRQTRFPSLAVICLLCWVADTAHGQPAPSPAPFEVVEASISELQDAMTTGRVTSAELVDAYLSRIAAYDQGGPRLNTLIRLNPGARATAEALDRERTTRGSRGPAARDSDHPEGQLRHGRHADDRGFGGTRRAGASGTMASRCAGCARRARSSSASPTSTSWHRESRRSARSAGRPATRTIRRVTRAGRAAAPGQRSRAA